MTIFGVDVSEHQNGMSLSQAKREGIDFVILRLCDGTYVDKVFRSHLADAEAAGLLVSTYWYLRAPSEGTTIAQQVDVIDRQMNGRRDLAVWIDVESVAGNRKLLTKDDVWAAKRELEKRGYHVPGIYSGAWYWEKMPGGEPSMNGLGYLWVSNYGRNRTAPYRDAYTGDGGDNHAGWAYPLGDRKPDILQYGSNGLVAGFRVDVNAYRGSVEELRSLFAGKGDKPAPPPAPERKTVEKVLDYPRDQVVQDTYYYCGPASSQTVIRAATGRLVGERDLASQMGTHTGGTNSIYNIKPVLDRHVPDAGWQAVEMPNDPPTNDQKTRLWNDLTRSIDGGYGVVANIVAPPSNYPRASYKSDTNLAYGGGVVYHYVAVMGYAQDDKGQRHVWLADSGFRPYGSWITFDQLATLIPPKGYVAATRPKPGTAPAIREEVKRMTQTLDDVVKTLVPGSEFKDARGNFILHADKNSFLAMKNTETLIGLVQRIDGKLAGLDKRLEQLEARTN